jgi:hypothetical protein
MCMSPPDIEVPKPPPAPKPADIPEPPGPPAPPAPSAEGGAAEKQGAPEEAGKGDGKRKRKDRSSLRIPKNQSRGVNLPGAGGGN